MRVNFYGAFRAIAGAKTFEFNIGPGDTLLHLLHAMMQKFPALRDEIFDEDGRLYPSIPLFLNGRNPRLLQGGVNTPIHQQDVLSVFTPVSSGRINVEQVNSPPAG